MPSFNITGLSTTARVLDDDDLGFIGVNGALVTARFETPISATDANGNYAITVLGAVNAHDESAIDTDGGTLDLFIGEDASIVSIGGFYDAITGSLTGNYEIVNNGSISAYDGGYGIRMFTGDTGNNGLVVNTGDIGGAGGVVFRGQDFGNYKIYNTGTITGTFFGAIYVDGINQDSNVTFFLDNSGIIQGAFNSVDVQYAELTLLNSGTMTGWVASFGDDDDWVVNTGLIEGFIRLSAGDDFVDSRGGEIVATSIADDEMADDVDIDMGQGDDTAYGSNLADRIEGGFGEDRLRGYTGDDEIEGGNGNDDVRGGAGDDFVLGGNDNDMVHGGSGNDRVRGNAGNDEVRGGSGDDVVTGGSGNDIVAGGRGDDDLYGNSGADVFVFNADAGFDIIRDYRDALDMIDLSALGTRFNRVDAATEVVNGNAIIDLDALGGSGTIVVLGAGGNLDAGDFIF